MDTSSEPTWGVKVSFGPYSFTKRHIAPAWVPQHASKWNDAGVLVWDRQRPQVVYLAPDRALDLLAQLQADTTWQQSGTTIGDTLYTFPQAPSSPSPPVSATPEPEASATDRKQARPTELPDSFGKPYTVNPLPLTPEQTHELYAVLMGHEADLRALAEKIYERGRAALARLNGRVRGQARKAEVQALDLSARPYPWVVELSPLRLVCDVPPNRGSVYLTENARFWRGCIERPGRHKLEGVGHRTVESALAWVEEQLRAAAEQDARPSELTVKPPRLSLATMTPEVRAQLVPYWIEPAAFEPQVRTFQVVMHLQHAPTSVEQEELSFGEMHTRRATYPSPAQLKQSLSLGGTNVTIEDAGEGRFALAFTTTYAKEALAVEQAQRLWERSLLASSLAARVIEWAYFGVAEVETGYVDVLGGTGDWSSRVQDRASYLAERAFLLTVVHALDVTSYRAMTGCVFKDYSDEQVLAMLHEHRTSSPHIPLQAREESRRWLKEHDVQPRPVP